MRKSIMHIVLITLSLLMMNYLLSQEIKKVYQSKHRIGFIIGFGGQNIDQMRSDLNEEDSDILGASLLSNGLNPDVVGLDVQYFYQVRFFQAQYYYSFLRRRTWGIDILVQPQYNMTNYRHINNILSESKGYEFGINAGLLVRKNIFKDLLSTYLCISTGPHYVSGTPERQANGFIFSDNLLLGFNIKILENTYLDLRPGFRHISNANLTPPNGGINSFVLGGGVLINM